MQLTGIQTDQKIGELMNQIGFLKDELESSRQAEGKLLNLIDSSNILIIRWKTDGMITFVNEFAMNFFGYSREEIAVFNTIVPSAESPAGDLKDTVNKIVSEPGNYMRFENEKIRKNGEHVWISWMNQAVMDKEGKVIEVLSVGVDITERKKSEERTLSETIEIEAILSCIADGVVVYDKSGRIIRSNAAADSLLKLKESDKLLTLAERLPQKYRVFTEEGRQLKPDEMPAFRAAVKGETVRNVPLLIEVMGDPHWINMSAAPLIVSGRHAGGVISLSEFTPLKRSREELSKNEQRLQAMFNNVAIGILEVDSDDRIISVNGRTCEILGYTPEELSGKTVSEITAPEFRQLSDEMNARLHRGDFNVFDYEKRYLRRDGTPLWVHVTVSAIRNSEGKHVNSIGTIEDISARKRFEEELSESKQRLQVIFDKAAIGIAEVDANDRFIAVNDRLCEIVGYRREELLGKSVPEITFSEDLQHSRDMIKKLQNGELDMFDFEKRYLKSDGTRIWVHVSLSAVRDLNRKYLKTIRTVEDISEKKKNEIEIRQKNEELTRFIYTVSHDLRSPLVTIKSFTAFLRENIEKNDWEAQEKDINYIQKAADRMGRLLDELLELSRIGRKDQPKTKTPLRAIAQAAIDAVAGRIEQKKIKIIFSGPDVLLYGHNQRLVQLYQNLIDNSAKFTGDQKDPVIEIGCYADEKRNETVLFVRDNGPGIDPRHHHKLFGLFEKLNDREEGTGVGLALVKRIVEIHGGSIWFESGEGKGTTFFFTLDGTEIIH